jgi:TPR repeat protein
MKTYYFRFLFLALILNWTTLAWTADAPKIEDLSDDLLIQGANEDKVDYQLALARRWGTDHLAASLNYLRSAAKKGNKEAILLSKEMEKKYQNFLNQQLQNAHAWHAKIIFKTIVCEDIVGYFPNLSRNVASFDDNLGTLRYLTTKEGRLQLVLLDIQTYTITNTIDLPGMPADWSWRRGSNIAVFWEHTKDGEWDLKQNPRKLYYVDLSKGKCVEIPATDANRVFITVGSISSYRHNQAPVWINEHKIVVYDNHGDSNTKYILDLNTMAVESERVRSDDKAWGADDQKIIRNFKNQIFVQQDPEYIAVGATEINGTDNLYSYFDPVFSKTDAISFPSAQLWFSSDNRHIFAIEPAQNNANGYCLVHYVVGADMDRHPADFQFTASKPQLPPEKGVLIANVFSPAINPITDKVVGPDRKTYKGQIQVLDWKNGTAQVRVGIDVKSDIKIGDIVTDFRWRVSGKDKPVGIIDWAALSPIAPSERMSPNSVGELQGKKEETAAFSELVKKAEKEDVTAMRTLGRAYIDGKDVQRNENLGFSWLLKGAEAGDVECMLRVASCYFEGLGVDKDHSKAIPWLEKASEKNNLTAKWRLGTAYRYGRGVPIDLTRAYTFYSESAEAGYTPSMVSLAEMVDRGDGGIAKDPSRSLEWLSKAAVAGNTLAMDRLGGRFETGIGVAKDYAKAIYWYQKGVDGGSGYSCANLGRMYRYGRGVPVNSEKAIELFRLGISKDSDWAMVYLGSMLENGTGIDKDVKQAIDLYLKAAKKK